ncbi:MAG: helix-turn-helix domain-containing protein, partial [Jatrophihabitans sp.]
PGDTVSAADVDALSGPRAGAGEGSADLIERHSSFTDYRDAAEKAFLARKLDENDWNVSETARKLGMQRSHLYKKIEKHELKRDGG